MHHRKSFGKRRIMVDAAVQERGLMGALDDAGLNSAFAVTVAVFFGLVALNWWLG